MYINRTDKINKLIDEVLSGNDEALVELYELLENVTGYITRRYFQNNNIYISSHEIYQYALLSLYHSVKTYDKNMDCTLATYYSVVFDRDLRLYLRHVNSKTNKMLRNAVSIDSTINESDNRYVVEVLENTDNRYDPVVLFDNRMIYSIIEEELSVLSKDMADVFRMWMQGYTFNEIAEKKQIKKRQAEYVVKQIRENLKCKLKDWKKE